MNEHFPDFVLNEVLPAVRKMRTRDGRPINISTDGNDHAATGASHRRHRLIHTRLAEA